VIELKSFEYAAVVARGNVSNVLANTHRSIVSSPIPFNVLPYALVGPGEEPIVIWNGQICVEVPTHRGRHQLQQYTPWMHLERYHLEKEIAYHNNISVNASDPILHKEAHELLSLLNLAGKDGWELCEMDPSIVGNEDARPNHPTNQRTLALMRRVVPIF
jgi:hypothetical protein